MPRMQWTADLHQLFVQVVMFYGGEKIATPKKILRLMGGRGLTVSQVKSHLQMYRKKKKEESIQEERMIRERRERQSQYLQIYERARDNYVDMMQNQQRIQRNTDERITAVLELSNQTMASSSMSFFQSPRVGLNGNGDNGNNGVIVTGGHGENDPLNSTEVPNGEAKLSLDLTLGLKY